MGSIAVLTTSGDNDPEIHPVQSYRHYLYCDACGSFDLDANPRGLTESDVPRPLGRSPFLQGRTVGPAPAVHLSRLPMTRAIA